MLTFYKHITDDSGWHYGAYLAFLCLKASLDMQKSNRPIPVAPEPQYDKVKTYKFSDDSTLKIKYKPYRISFQYHQFIPAQITTTRSNPMYDHFQAKKGNVSYDFLSENSRNYKLNDITSNGDSNSLMKLQWLSDKASWLSKKLPFEKRLSWRTNPGYGCSYDFATKRVESEIKYLQQKISNAEKYLGINKQQKTPSAPPYNPQRMFASIKPKPKKNDYKNNSATYMNVNVNINIGKINCRIM